MLHYVHGVLLEMTSSYRHSSVGIICYSVHKHDVYFLLGKESKRYSQRIGKWCDFGGVPNAAESYVDTAVREFMEESMCVIQLDNTTPVPMNLYKNKLHTILRQRQYHLFCKVMNGTVLRIFYILKVPWQPDVCTKFIKYRQQLINFQAKKNDHSIPFSWRNFPGIHQNEVMPSYLEKTSLRYWHVDKLSAYMSQQNKVYTFRRGFLQCLEAMLPYIYRKSKCV